MNKKNKKKKGFTLIELLVVVIIIGVLAAIALPSYMRSVERSRAANPVANLGAIAKAQNAYRMGTEHYTNDVGNLDISLKDESNGEDATGDTFESEFFTYKVYGDDKAVAVATRKDVPDDKKYELSVSYGTNQIYCRPIENKTCIDLGLEEGQNYGSNESRPCNGELDAILGEESEETIVGWHGGTCVVTGDGVIHTSWCETIGLSGRHCFDGDILGGNTGIETYYGCQGNNVSDDKCLSYDEMTEYNLSDYGRRYCQEINGFECETWSDWEWF